MMGDLDDLRELQRRARKSELLIIQQKLSLLKNKGKCRQKFRQSKNASNKIKNVSNEHFRTAGSNATLATASLSISSGVTTSTGMTQHRANIEFKAKRQANVGRQKEKSTTRRDSGIDKRAPSVQKSRSGSRSKH